MKHLLQSTILLALLYMGNPMTLSAQTAERNTLFVFLNSSSTPRAFSLETLDKITFTSHSMKMHEAQKVTELEFSTFSFMSLDANITPTTDIRSLSFDDDANIQYYLTGSSIVVESDSMLEGINIYDLQGRLVASDKQESKTYSLSLARVPHGVFVVQVFYNGKVLSKKMVK